MLTLAQPGAKQLVSFWAHTGELPWFVDTLVLAQVTGVAALIDVCQVTSPSFINCSQLKVEQEQRTEQIGITEALQTDRQTEWVSYRYKQSHQAPAHSPGHSDTGRCRTCCNTSESRGHPYHIHSHLKGGKVGFTV